MDAERAAVTAGRTSYKSLEARSTIYAYRWSLYGFPFAILVGAVASETLPQKIWMFVSLSVWLYGFVVLATIAILAGMLDQRIRERGGL